MVNFLKNIQLPSAAFRRSNRQDWSSTTITTQDFFRPSVVYRQVLSAGDSVDIDVSHFMRLQPQIKPLLARGRAVTRAFYVPFRLLFDGYNNFITQTPYQSRLGASGSSYLLSSCPYTTLDDLFWLLCNHSDAVITDVDRGDINDEFLSSISYDIVYHHSADDSYSFYKFTNLSRFYYDILVALGYKVVSNTILADASDDMCTDYYSKHLNALPLLAFIKVWSDWYAAPQYEQQYTIDYYLKQSSAQAGYHYDSQILNNLLYRCYTVLYDTDYFTAQWDNPQGPNVATGLNVSLTDVTSPHDGLTAYASDSAVKPDNYGTPVITPTTNLSTAGNNISQYLVDALKRVTDFVRRRQYSGNRVIDNFLAQFGISNRFERLLRCEYLGGFDTDIDFTEVVASTDDGSSQPLGDFAGRAVGYSKGRHIKYTCDDGDDGILLVVSYIEPKIMNVAGIDRFILDTKPLDFYSPSFDGLGVQATAKCEVKADLLRNVNGSANLFNTFGFIPRYAHYKIGHDILAGDFARPLYKDSSDVWHFARNIETGYPSSNEYDDSIQHSLAFIRGDSTQYNRVFAIQDTANLGVDNFVSVYQFSVTAHTHKLPLFDNYDFDNEDEHVTISQHVNGTQIN